MSELQSGHEIYCSFNFTENRLFVEGSEQHGLTTNCSSPQSSQVILNSFSSVQIAALQEKH